MSRTVLMCDAVEAFIKKDVPINDIPLATLIATCEPLKHVRETNTLYMWDGSVWEEAHDNLVISRVINQAIIQWIEELQLHSMSEHAKCTPGKGCEKGCAKARATEKKMRGYLGSTRITNLLKALKRDEHVSISIDDLDADPYLVNFKNCVVDVRTGDYSSAHPDKLMTNQVAAWYNPEATHADWDKALNAMSLMDAPTRRWVQMYLGSGLLGVRLRDSLTVFMVGNGSNGKSTIIDTCAAMLGDYAGFVPKTAVTGTDYEAAVARLAFKGLRLAMLDETKAGARLDADATKSISGVTITARKLGSGNVTFKASHTFLISTNHEPRVVEADNGIARRLVKVPFDRTFKATDADYDPGLSVRLEEGADGRAEAVLAWLMEGARMFIAQGETLLPLPAALTESTEDWLEETDLIGQFLDAECVFTGDPMDRVTNTELFRAFNRWCYDNSHESKYVSTGFSKAVKAHRKVSSQGVTTFKSGSNRGLGGLMLSNVPSVPTEGSIVPTF